jgi:hypothetical protein
MAEPGAQPISHLQVIYNRQVMDVNLHDLSRDQVEAYLADHPNEIVLRAPSQRARASDPNAVLVISFVHPYENRLIHLTATHEDISNQDILTSIQSAISPAEMFVGITTDVPMQGGRRRKHRRTHRKRRTHGKRSTYGKRKTHHRRNKRKQSSKRRAH